MPSTPSVIGDFFKHLFYDGSAFGIDDHVASSINSLFVQISARSPSPPQIPSSAAGSKDKFGLSWQIYPPVLGKLLGDKNKEKAGRVMRVMLQMKKIEIAELERAHEGK